MNAYNTLFSHSRGFSNSKNKSGGVAHGGRTAVLLKDYETKFDILFKKGSLEFYRIVRLCLSLCCWKL